MSWLLLALAAAVPVVALSVPTSDLNGSLFAGIMRTSYPAHPRLILTPSRIDALKQEVSSNEEAFFFFNGTYQQASYLLQVPPFPVPRPNSTGDARYALQRIYSLSIMWALTLNETWAARAMEEVLVVAAWPCFDVPCGEAQLNSGEALHALAVALDWLYDYMSTSQRATIIKCV